MLDVDSQNMETAVSLNTGKVTGHSRGPIAENRQFMKSAKRFSTLILTPLFLAFSISSVGCGPSLKSTIDVPRVEFSGEKKGSGLKGSQLSIEQFTDKRISKIIAGETEAPLDKGAEAKQPIGPAVQDGLKRAFADRGAEITETAPVVISGEVLRWYAAVSGGLSGKAKGEAVVRIEVFDPANKKIYAGTYEGSATMQRPSLSEKDVSETLGAAMAQALSQVSEDKQLVKVLASY